jgi:hypothetical protein
MLTVEDDIEIDDCSYEEHLSGSEFVYDIKELAKEYMVNFFANKEMYCGGPIPKQILLNNKNLSIVLNSNIEETLPKIYVSIEDSFSQLESDSGLVADDIKLIISILKQCSRFGIPKEFSVGIMILYLEYCEGLEIKWD